MGKPSPLIAVTGATGFIGTSLCTNLLNSGKRVRALVRNPERAAALQRIGVELQQGDLDNKESLAKLLTGAEAVIHCAGAVRGNSQQQFDRTNVEGTASLVDVMQLQAAPIRLIMLSSLAARQPELSWYARSKYRGEQIVRERGDGLDWVILRPPAVYGPGDKEMLPVFRAMSHGVAPVPGKVTAKISLIHVKDLVRAITACLERKDMPVGSYCLCDGQAGGYAWQDLANIAGTVWQRRVRLVRIAPWILDLIANINLGLSRVLGYAPMLTPAKLRELRHPDWVVSNEELQAVVDWQPKIELREGLTELGETEL